MENKRTINFVATEPVAVFFNEQRFLIESYISLKNQYILTENYIESYFNDLIPITDRQFNAKYSLILGVVDLCTTISIENMDLDELISSGLWNIIVKEIKNFDELLMDIEKIVRKLENERAIQMSVGSIIDRGVQKFLSFIENMDLSEKTINELSQVFNISRNNIDELIFDKSNQDGKKDE
jgi:hypothetical protein